MTKRKFLTLLFPVLAGSAFSSFYGFEENIPSAFVNKGKGRLAVTTQYYKEGNSSLEWAWKGDDILEVNDPDAFQSSVKKKNNGITLWIYNEIPSDNPLNFDFLTSDGKSVYTFSFGLNFCGWRACWMKYEDMNLIEANASLIGNISKLAIRKSNPEKKGRLFIDRLTISDKKINDQVTPDAQLPFNNRSLSRTLWHWCRIWEWEQYQNDMQVVGNSEADLATLESRIDKLVSGKVKNSDAALKKAINKYRNLNIRKEKGVVKGNPLLSNDELNKKAKEASLTDVNDMIYGFAADWYMKANEESKKRFFDVFDYAINQGFAYGSCMGTNHHYGYQIRDIFDACWMMRDEISQNKDIHRAIAFWSGLQETRKPYQRGRDELLDSWNTLLMPRLISAMLYVDADQRNIALQGLSRWVSGSLDFTPGTIGGIKTDGTTFHHGGFYPAYSTGALSTIGTYYELTKGTSFCISDTAEERLKLAVNTMINYTCGGEWTNGICGRHPFDGKISTGVQRLYENLYDADYKKASVPSGFFTYNYGAFGVHRRDKWLVSLKGFNAHVWNSEIYTKDNRYGRYQSYGAVEILNRNIGKRKENGFVEDGWDWSRIPGTTTIHLPIDELESPLPGTLMVRSQETFAGATGFAGTNGMFAISFQERDFRNFTPDFKAKKTVFCFDNRLICLGSDISNSNEKYETETTLFQNWLPKEPQHNLIVAEKGYGKQVFADMNGNYYQLPESQDIRFAQQKQTSKQNKTKKATEGFFASAWIAHGKAPKEAGYEYMILIAPGEKEKKSLISADYYRVLRKDRVAHIVFDKKTGITAAAYFEDFQSQDQAELIRGINKESLVMYKQTADGTLQISICDPDLNIPEYTYTTAKDSEVKEKQILLTGIYQLKEKNPAVECSVAGENTLLKVRCREGIPVEFNLSVNL